MGDAPLDARIARLDEIVGWIADAAHEARTLRRERNRLIYEIWTAAGGRLPMRELGSMAGVSVGYVSRCVTSRGTPWHGQGER